MMAGWTCLLLVAILSLPQHVMHSHGQLFWASGEQFWKASVSMLPTGAQAWPGLRDRDRSG